MDVAYAPNGANKIEHIGTIRENSFYSFTHQKDPRVQIIVNEGLSDIGARSFILQ